MTQTAIFTLGFNKVGHVWMGNIKSGHLRTTTATGTGHGETHFVVDIHEGQWAAGVGAGAGYKRAFRTQGRELVAYAATGF